MGTASADVTVTEGGDQEDSLVALVLWRLHDPSWNPSFGDLLEDARTCADPASEPATLLSVLRAVVTSDAALAPRARTLAMQAQRLMTARGLARSGAPDRVPPAPRRLLGGLRTPLLRP